MRYELLRICIRLYKRARCKTLLHGNLLYYLVSFERLMPLAPGDLWWSSIRVLTCLTLVSDENRNFHVTEAVDLELPIMKLILKHHPIPANELMRDAIKWFADVRIRIIIVVSPDCVYGVYIIYRFNITKMMRAKSIKEPIRLHLCNAYTRLVFLFLFLYCVNISCCHCENVVLKICSVEDILVTAASPCCLTIGVR